MEKSFKETYIEEQKRQEMERNARLAKIGMGSKNASSQREQRPLATPSEVSPKRPESGRAQPVKRPAPRTAPAVKNAPPVNPQRKSAPTAPSNGVTRERPSANPAVRGGADVPVRQQRPSAPVNKGPQTAPATAAVPPHLTRRGNPANTAGVTAPAPQRGGERPVRQTSRPVGDSSNMQGDSDKTRVFTKQNRENSPLQGERTKKRAPSDEEIFKKTLSENEAKAMMFALTGKAADPDDGGNVDIINIGRIPAPGRNSKDVKKKKSNIGKYIGRGFAVLGGILVFAIIAVYVTVFLIAHGPSDTFRDKLVQDATQASATKWVPYLFLSGDTVEGIINASHEVEEDVMTKEEYETVIHKTEEEEVDKWANAQDGMIFEVVSDSTYKAYVLLVKDPKRVFVGTSSDTFSASKPGINVFKAAARYNAVACINAGEFVDMGGGGTGSTPMGLTYSQGKCVWNDGLKRTFIGIDKNDRLVVCEPMTKAKADEMGIRDAVSFQNGKILITKDGDNVIRHYQDNNIGTAQRTAIGQREDGTFILLVTDGRTASSPGATHNDVIDLMISYGAVTAGMLDGGSSTTMYYRDYFTKYDYDVTKLDQYQKQGLVNNYKAFTEPRYIPTFFVVAPE